MLQVLPYIHYDTRSTSPSKLFLVTLYVPLLGHMSLCEQNQNSACKQNKTTKKKQTKRQDKQVRNQQTARMPAILQMGQADETVAAVE